MKIILIIGICLLIGAYLIYRFLSYVYLYPMVVAEFEEYKRLRHQFSNQRLEWLHKRTQKAVQRIENVLAYDNDVLATQLSLEEKISLEADKTEDEKMLKEFQAILAEVERELNARAYFNAQR
ncbi:MAG: hypothetical protein IJ545_01595 [Alphaproteobacteria bacterium]|nr:hypothetical protein [Alphaproteobacteria bacterium]